MTVSEKIQCLLDIIDENYKEKYNISNSSIYWKCEYGQIKNDVRRKNKMSKYQEMLTYVKRYQEKHKDKNGNVPNPIFEIMVFEYPNKEMIYHRPDGDIPSGFPDTGCIDHMGFYYELDTAIQAMNENWCDIQETCYHAGFILCRFPGLYYAGISRMYFLWDEGKKGFFEAEEPEIFKHVAY